MIYSLDMIESGLQHFYFCGINLGVDADDDEAETPATAAPADRQPAGAVTVSVLSLVAGQSTTLNHFFAPLLQNSPGFFFSLRLHSLLGQLGIIAGCFSTLTVAETKSECVI